jgi:hypothetical protein
VNWNCRDSIQCEAPTQYTTQHTKFRDEIESTKPGVSLIKIKRVAWDILPLALCFVLNYYFAILWSLAHLPFLAILVASSSLDVAAKQMNGMAL